jgi:hypothetical protein
MLEIVSDHSDRRASGGGQTARSSARLSSAGQTVGGTVAVPGRRAVLQAGGLGLLGLSLPRVLQAEASRPRTLAAAPRAKSVIFLFLFGGPSQHETFDLKPLAPDAIRGHFRPIPSRTPGLQICEHLPRLAACSDRYAVLRTMSHDYHDHSGGAHYLQTGQRWQIPIGGGFNATPQDWPSIGSVAQYHWQAAATAHADHASSDLPPYMTIPNPLGSLESHSFKLIRPGEYAGWLGRRWDPVSTRIDKQKPGDNPYFRPCSDEELSFQLRGLIRPADITLDRLSRRQSLLEQFDQQLGAPERDRRLATYDQFQRQAMDLVSSQRTRQALDILQESPETRDRYGRHLFGQATLMARRLIQAGSRFVTVHWEAVSGYCWDSHINANDVRDHLLPGFDQAASALLDDLQQTGLLDETLVVALGEMGRTHKLNRTGGRDHWATLFPALLAGAGIRGGTVWGESDADGAYAATIPYTPERLAATVYHALGIDPEQRLPDEQGRPIPILSDASPIDELWL